MDSEVGKRVAVYTQITQNTELVYLINVKILRVI